MKPMTRIATLITFLAVLALVSSDVQASGRYTRGRTLLQRYCGVCLATGWKWAPTPLPKDRRPALVTWSRTWSPARVCTWMRKPPRAMKGPGCYPGYIPPRDRLDILYYVYRRSQEKTITAPRLTPRPLQVYRGKPLRKTLAVRRATALKQHRSRMMLRRMRSRPGSIRVRPRRVRTAKPRVSTPARAKTPVRQPAPRTDPAKSSDSKRGR